MLEIGGFHIRENFRPKNVDKLEVPNFWEDGLPGRVHGYVVNDHG